MGCKGCHLKLASRDRLDTELVTEAEVASDLHSICSDSGGCQGLFTRTFSCASIAWPSVEAPPRGEDRPVGQGQRT